MKVKPFSVDPGDVAGPQPAVLDQGLGGGLVVVQVALHHLRAADPDLALLALGYVLLRSAGSIRRASVFGISAPTLPGGVSATRASRLLWLTGLSSVIP